MITEDYVSFEIAQLLKEKGFDEKCHSNYWCGSGAEEYTDLPLNYNDNSSSCSRPTHQMAMKWLREKGIDIDIYLSHTIEETRIYGFNVTNDDVFYHHDTTFLVYEEAVEAAIKYALENLI